MAHWRYRICCICGLFALSVLSGAGSSQAVEGGLDVYAPALNSNLGLAEFPEPGNYMLNYVYYLDGSFNAPHKAALTRAPKFGESAIAYVPVVAHISEHTLLGGNLWAAIAQPLGEADFGVGNVDFESQSLYDAYAIPIGLSWRSEHLDIALYEGLNVPWGTYNANEVMYLGLNYWAFDTNLLVSYRIPETKFEFDFDLGYSINTKNQATDYLSGQAIHWDWTFGYKFNPRFRVGLQGYIYYQTTGDSGTGATAGPFRGESVGFGPSIKWIVGKKDFPIELDLTWQVDVHAKNRARYNAVALQADFSLKQFREKLGQKLGYGDHCRCD